jgi:ABC-type glycerol-3-phosphate transport system substrate-binding protein
MKIRRALGVTMAVAALAVAAGCSSGGSSGGGGGSGGSTVIHWWTWDPNQAQAYEACATVFHKANPDITVQISQYDVNDYFTKLTAGFVAGNAPDAFQNSPQYFEQYANQHQLMPLNSFISASKLNLNQYSVGVSMWQYKDGKQYALPMDWASAGIFYNKTMLTKAGFTQQQVDNMTWNPTDGGTFTKMVAHMTVDDKGVRGDQPGFDKSHIKTYGIGVINTDDFTGQTSWSPFVSTLGWTLGNTVMWPTQFNYNDPRFVETMNWVKSLQDKGYAPPFDEFTQGNGQGTIADYTLLGTGKVAMTVGGSWEAATFSKLPGVQVGIAPTVLGPSNTRAIVGSSNGNNMWAGTKNPQPTWKWMSYQESQACQTLAGKSGTFFPSIAASMNAVTQTLAAQGVDLSTWTTALADKEVHPAEVYTNGNEMQLTIQPLFDAFFTGKQGDAVFAQMQQQSQKILTSTSGA